MSLGRAISDACYACPWSHMVFAFRTSCLGALKPPFEHLLWHHFPYILQVSVLWTLQIPSHLFHTIEMRDWVIKPKVSQLLSIDVYSPNVSNSSLKTTSNSFLWTHHQYHSRDKKKKCLVNASYMKILAPPSWKIFYLQEDIWSLISAEHSFLFYQVHHHD